MSFENSQDIFIQWYTHPFKRDLFFHPLKHLKTPGVAWCKSQVFTCEAQHVWNTKYYQHYTKSSHTSHVFSWFERWKWFCTCVFTSGWRFSSSWWPAAAGHAGSLEQNPAELSRWCVGWRDWTHSPCVPSAPAVPLSLPSPANSTTFDQQQEFSWIKQACDVWWSHHRPPRERTSPRWCSCIWWLSRTPQRCQDTLCWSTCRWDEPVSTSTVRKVTEFLKDETRQQNIKTLYKQ